MKTENKLGVAKLAYTVKEAAEALGVSTKTVYRWIIRGKLRVCKLLSKKMIPRKDVESFYEENSGLEWGG